MDEVKNETVENVENTEATDSKANEETKTFNQEQVNELISERLERERKKFKEQSEKMKNDLTSKIKSDYEAKKSEAKKLGQMNATEKAEYERDKAMEELNVLKQGIERQKLEREASAMLEEQNLTIHDDELLGMLVPKGSNAEDVKKRISLFSEKVNGIIQTQVESELKKKMQGHSTLPITDSVNTNISEGASFAKSMNSQKNVKSSLWD